jgi:hypothetical protein
MSRDNQGEEREKRKEKVVAIIEDDSDRVAAQTLIEIGGFLTKKCHCWQCEPVDWNTSRSLLTRNST